MSLKTSFTLTSDTGTASGDIRRVTFRFLHDQLFHIFRNVDLNDYAGFNVSIVSMKELTTGTAPVGITNSRIALLRCNTAIPTANRIIDDQTYIMGSNQIGGANATIAYYSAINSTMFCYFSDFYEFTVTLSGGFTAAQIAAYTTNGYLPASWCHVYQVDLIPKIK
jgi:hypothetical protein